MYVRNNVVHAIAIKNETGDYDLHLRSGNRTLTKDQVFSTEELTNYLAHAVYSLRYAIGVANAPGMRHTLPDRPPIPDFLLSVFPGLQAQKRQNR